MVFIELITIIIFGILIIVPAVLFWMYRQQKKINKQALEWAKKNNQIPGLITENTESKAKKK